MGCTISNPNDNPCMYYCCHVSKKTMHKGTLDPTVVHRKEALDLRQIDIAERRASMHGPELWDHEAVVSARHASNSFIDIQRDHSDLIDKVVSPAFKTRADLKKVMQATGKRPSMRESPAKAKLNGDTIPPSMISSFSTPIKTGRKDNHSMITIPAQSSRSGSKQSNTLDVAQTHPKKKTHGIEDRAAKETQYLVEPEPPCVYQDIVCSPCLFFGDFLLPETSFSQFDDVRETRINSLMNVYGSLDNMQVLRRVNHTTSLSSDATSENIMKFR